MVSEVFRICDAYEAGYGKGQVSSEDVNPFPDGSKEHEAWDIGYQTAIKLELDRFGVLPYNDQHNWPPEAAHRSKT